MPKHEQLSMLKCNPPLESSLLDAIQVPLHDRGNLRWVTPIAPCTIMPARIVVMRDRDLKPSPTVRDNWLHISARSIQPDASSDRDRRALPNATADMARIPSQAAG